MVYHHACDAKRTNSAPDWHTLRRGPNVPSSLPLQLTSLVGREAEVAQVIEALQHARLVTLTGVGGVGKTRLALRVADDLNAEYADGSGLVALATVGDPAVLGYVVADALGISQQPGRSIEDVLIEALSAREMLIVLDNCEHLIDEVAALVERIIETCPGVRLLPTSREALMVAGERIWPVPSLAHHGTDAPAITLFRERAEAVDPAFSIAVDVEVIEDVCRQLDGIPLAIELAAARIRSMSPRQILERLNERFALLTGGSRSALERHQTLRHAVQWSYDLLDERERKVLQRASVFVGGFSLEATEVVCAIDGADGTELLDTLDSLVRKSLVTVERSEGEARFGLLETIRQFAEEQLLNTGEGASVRRLHARYFAEAADIAWERFASPEQGRALSWFDREFANVRAAFRSSLDQGDINSSALIAVTASFTVELNRFEAVAWAREILEAVRESCPEHLADVLSAASTEGFVSGSYEAGLGYGREAIDLVESGRGRVRSAIAWTTAGYCALSLGQGKEGLDILHAGAQRPEDRSLLYARALWSTAIAMTSADPETVQTVEDVLSEARAARVPTGLAWALIARSYVYKDLDPAKAEASAREALTIAREAGLANLEGAALRDLSVQIAQTGEATTALATFSAAMDALEPAGESGYMRFTLGQLGILFARLGRFDDAAFTAISVRSDHVFVAIEQERFDLAIETSRQAIGESEFSALADRVAAMSYREVMTEVRERIAQSIAEVQDAAQSEPTSYPHGLSEREVEVLRLVAAGRTNADIAQGKSVV